MTYICVVEISIIGSDNGLSPGRRQAIIWTNAWILFIGPLGTNFIEILIGVHTFWSKKMHLKMSSGKWQPFCLGLNVLKVMWYKDFFSICGFPWLKYSLQWLMPEWKLTYWQGKLFILDQRDEILCFDFYIHSFCLYYFSVNVFIYHGHYPQNMSTSQKLWHLLFSYIFFFFPFCSCPICYTAEFKLHTT